MIWSVRIIGGWSLGREAMGFGDVTLLAMIGTFLGWQACLLVFFLAPFAGIVIGVGGVSASGGQGITASLLGQSVSVGGGQAQSTLGTSTTASSTSQAAAQTANTDAKEQVASNAADEDDKKKKKGNGPALARRVGRVTVILPKS